MVKYCNSIIISLLLFIVVGVPLYFDIRIFSVFDLSKITLLYFLAFAIIVIWCIKRICDSSGRLEHCSLTYPIAGILIVNLFSTIFSINPIESLLGEYKRYDGFISLCIYVMLFFVTIHYIKLDFIHVFFNFIIITACLSCVYGLLEYFGYSPLLWNTMFSGGSSGGGRIFGTLGHPAFFSAYLIMVLPLTCYQIIKSRVWYLFICAFSLIFITFFLTKTRASFLGLLASTGFLVYGARRELINQYKRFIIIACIFVFLAVVMGGTYMTKRFANDINIKESGGLTHKLKGSAHNRWITILTAIEVIKDYPVLGIGADTFYYAYTSYVKKVTRTVPSELQDRAHQDMLDTALRSGLIGLGIYFWLIYSFIKMIWCSQNEHKLLQVVLVSSIIAYFVQNQLSFGHVFILVLYWMILALCVISSEKLQTQCSI